MTVETIPTTVPAEPTTPIRPSEALRLGRLIRPIEAEVGETLYAGRKRACALGAMALGYGFDPKGHEPTDAYGVVADHAGLSYDHDDSEFGGDGTLKSVWARFDEARAEGQSGDAAVLAYLESRGL